MGTVRLRGNGGGRVTVAEAGQLLLERLETKGRRRTTRYGEYQASVDFQGDVVVGWLPSRALGFVSEWALLHADELQANWDRARDSQPLLPIEPLA
jgi:hypothetical protein